MKNRIGRKPLPTRRNPDPKFLNSMTNVLLFISLPLAIIALILWFAASR